MQTGMFKEVIDTIISEINVSTNMFFWKQQLKTIGSGMQNSFWPVGGTQSFLDHLVVRGW